MGPDKVMPKINSKFQIYYLTHLGLGSKFSDFENEFYNKVNESIVQKIFEKYLKYV